MRISDWSSDVCSSELDRLFSTAGIFSFCGRGRAKSISWACRTTISSASATPVWRAKINAVEVSRNRFIDCIDLRSEEHTSELQSLMRISYAVFCLKKKTTTTTSNNSPHRIPRIIKSVSNTHNTKTLTQYLI